MIINVKYLKILLIVLALVAAACSPVRVKRTTGAKAPVKTEKPVAEKKTEKKTRTNTDAEAADRLKTRFSDTTVIYLDKPPE